MELGADPEDLNRWARELRQAAGSLDAARRRLGASVHHAPWHGPDATAFRRDWGTHDHTLARVSGMLVVAAADADAQATQQRLASEPGTDARAAPPGDPLPESEERWSGHLTVNATALVGGGVTVAVADLPGPGSLVTLTGEAELGAAASAGAGAEVHGSGQHGGSAGGTATAAVAVTGTQGWYVDDGRARAFAADRVRDLAVDHGVDTVLGAGSSGVLRRIFGAGTPAPAVVTELLGVALGGSALVTSTVGGPLAGTASGSTTWQAGRRRRGDEESYSESLVLSIRGRGAATVAATLAGTAGPGVSARGRGLAGSAAAEVELFPAEAGLRPVVVTATATTGGQAVTSRTTAWLDRSGARALEGVWDGLRDGDPSAVAGHLHDAGRSVLVGPTEVVTGVVHTSTAGGSVSGRGGAGVGLGVEGTHTVVDWGDPGP